jgi:hypothetical protein
MNDVPGGKAPLWFRLLAVLGVAWNAIGVFMYLQKMGMLGDPLVGVSEAQRALAQSAPAWVTGAFAVAVFAGLLGTLALVVLKRWATMLLILSLVGVLVQMGWIVGISNAVAVEGSQAILMPVVITVIAVLLVWLANIGAKRGWLD